MRLRAFRLKSIRRRQREGLGVGCTTHAERCVAVRPKDDVPDPTGCREPIAEVATIYELRLSLFFRERRICTAAAPTCVWSASV